MMVKNPQPAMQGRAVGYKRNSVMSYYNRKNPKKKLVRRKNGRVIGCVENGIFTKNVKQSKHMLRHPKGWAIDTHAVEQAKRLGAKEINIKDKETNTVYKFSLNDFMLYSEEIDRGYGKQQFIPLTFWETIYP